MSVRDERAGPSDFPLVEKRFPEIEIRRPVDVPADLRRLGEYARGQSGGGGRLGMSEPDIFADYEQRLAEEAAARCRAAAAQCRLTAEVGIEASRTEGRTLRAAERAYFSAWKNLAARWEAAARIMEDDVKPKEKS